MRILFLFFLSIFLFSCNTEKSLSPQEMKIGTFKTTLKNSTISSIATRNDSIQIETYNNKKDTFYIHWKSDFEYVLKQKNPKNDLDSLEFVVKINGIHGKSYTFKAHYKGNKFIQKGTATKIKN